jgi:hypothetical protein
MQSINVIPGVPNSARHPFEGVSDTSPYYPERNFVISGVTKDATGTPLGGCSVLLFNAATNVLTQQAVADASGNYAFTVDKTQRWFVVAYLPGAPDVAGTSVNTLAGA